MDIFRRREGDLWERGQEVHREYAYELGELAGFLREAGFRRIRVCGDRRLRAPREGEERVFFAAWKD